MPDDGEIRAHLPELTTLLSAEPRRAAILLRRLLGRVTAEAIIAPGKKRGFFRLHFQFDAKHLLHEVLGKRVPIGILPDERGTGCESTTTVIWTSARPTLRDVLAPEIGAMQAKRMTLAQINHVVQLGIGDIHNVLRRWRDAQPSDVSPDY